MVIRPVTDLRNHFPDVERELKEEGIMYLTKNGYGAAVMLSIDEYKRLNESTDLPGHEMKMSDKSDRGIFSKYANPDLIAFEKEAGRKYVADRASRYIPGADSDE